MPPVDGTLADAVPPVSDQSPWDVSLQSATPSAAPKLHGSPPGSPSSLSSTSTADDAELSSPLLPALPSPHLPERALEYLRTPVVSEPGESDHRYVTTSWGSPYEQGEARHFRQASFSSDISDDNDDSGLSLSHQLAVSTRFLRPAPPTQPSSEALTPSSLTGNAAVLANRARRPVLGLTEDWIRTHTTEDPETEYRHWLSDTDESEHSLLSGSQTPNDAGWLEEADPRTPRAPLGFPVSALLAHRHQRARSSNETLRQALTSSTSPTMEPQALEPMVATTGHIPFLDSSPLEPAKPESPTTEPHVTIAEDTQEMSRPATPPRPIKQLSAQTPRLKKKVPWRGKNILILLPRDEERGRPGKAPKPLNAENVKTMLRDWEELGYNIRGFDLDVAQMNLDPTQETSQSCGQWPAQEDVADERSHHAYQVTLPDLSAWKRYQDELLEEKLRKLGVSLGGDDEPSLPPQSISPAISNLNRQASYQYPPLPFSPPLPTDSSASNGPHAFPFPAAFLSGTASSTAQSPGIPSPLSFHGRPMHGSKYNPRASIAISPHELPYFSGQPSPAWSPQMFLQNQMGRSGSPGLLNMNSFISPGSPFQRDDSSPAALKMHQRHQSLQYPMLPHQQLQRTDSARASPRLQDLREEEEEIQSNPYEGKSPSKTPEPHHFIRHNASDSLQKEIDDAEYHLEEQFRSQLEEPDYSPHKESSGAQPSQVVDASSAQENEQGHTRGPSVHFGDFGTDSDDGPKLHHPQPHSRGHSLSQKAFVEKEEARDSTDEAVTASNVLEKLDLELSKEKYDVLTKNSNPGTPLQAFNIVNKLHERTVSTTSNPWVNETSGNSVRSTHRPGHSSKPSLSKLNAGATEFKFDPTSSFTPTAFTFGGKTSQPVSAFPTFQPGAPSFEPSAPVFKPGASAFKPGASTFQPAVASFEPTSAPGHAKFSSVSTVSTAPRQQSEKPGPLFSPKTSAFNFAASGPSFNPAASTFNPGAAAFTPTGSFAPSVSSYTASATDGHRTRPNSIFGNINVNLADAAKTSSPKAVPIVLPANASSKSPIAARPSSPDIADGSDGRSIETDRVTKKSRDNIRDNNSDGDDVPMFAEPTPEPEVALMPAQEEPYASEEAVEPNHSIEEDQLRRADLDMDDKTEDEEAGNMGDTTLASTVLSESTDGKPQSEANDTKATSPSATPDMERSAWKPFEFRNHRDIMDFNSARPLGDVDALDVSHERNLSATALPFVAGGFTFGASHDADASFDPILKTEASQIALDEKSVSDDEPLDLGDSEDDRAGSPTPGPDFFDKAGRTPSPMPKKPSSIGLSSSRFASPPPAPAAKGLGASRFAESPSPPPRPAGLAASRFADVSSPAPEEATPVQLATQSLERFESLPVSPPSVASTDADERRSSETEDATFEEIDAVMQFMKENPTIGVNHSVGSLEWRQPSPERDSAVHHSQSPLPPQLPFPSEVLSLSPRQYRGLPAITAPVAAADLDDPFVDPPRSVISQTFDGHAQIHHLQPSGSVLGSEWDDAFSADEKDKLEQRSHYFDGHVAELVGSILASRLGPLEKSLGLIENAVGRNQSTRRARRSLSPDMQESDADDEDDDMPAHRSLSPRRDKKMDQIKMAVADVFNAQMVARALHPAQLESTAEVKDESEILKAIVEMKQQIAKPPQFDFNSDEFRSVIEAAVASQMVPPAPTVIKDDEEAKTALAEMQAKLHDLSQRLRDEEGRNERERARASDLEEKLRAEEDRRESEAATRRSVEDRAAEMRRQLDQAETKIEIEIMNRNIYDQRGHDLEERLRLQEKRAEEELAGRREAEDRLSEVQRLLRISSEEEDRLRSVLEERNQKIKAIEQTSSKTNMRLTLLEGVQKNAERTENELRNRLHGTETELRDSRQEARHWRAEAEQERQSSMRHAEEHAQAINETKHMHKLIDTLGVQLEENEKIRDNWRGKFVALQDDMAHAAREITEESSRRAKEKQSIVARMEVLDARLQAEARTRERLEVEVERLEGGERAAMRAVSECKRLETLLSELRTENHNLHQDVLHRQREVQEARDSGASEVQRTRVTLQAELDTANHQVNVVRAELDDEASRLRSQLDQVKLDADTASALHEMMLEEAQTSKKTDLDQLLAKHQMEIEDLQAKHERQINNAAEDAQQTEQNLLERLSLSTSKTEHLQDRISHLEEKVQVAQEAARAAAQAAAQAKSAPATAPVPVPAAPPAAATTQPGPVGQTKQLAEAMQLPGKISSQALRESIMVLQEQLQAREQRIEELEHETEKLDPEAATKISKRDDEITWLRELLAVRHGDLQDIIQALSADRFDREAVKDASIRLKANLQMEEQERERAMNGGSAISLPSIAASFRDAATPRVAQAVGPLAAAWGNWRKASQQQPSRNSSFSAAHNINATGRNATPSKSRSDSQSSLRSGLMTPPASNVRQTPPALDAQPTAFGNTGRRLTAEQFASRTRGPSMTSRQAEKMPMTSTPPPRGHGPPVTPLMMQPTTYDQDAQVEDFDDAAFFDD
ncbi:golgin subfamily A member 4 [Microdochium nivale]|nr:golgin subfamily A member 4 [Microdochium nivale]